ncbi:MAG: hypothetical protein I3273_00190 [Candidatus Moeniiplasma glomeromycotorum]|nr:hypothetical protein [Candidatus Moeniiplasma glomeromycotorum]MCE8167452.1 hypothetical protein [Candidatus Moeniiplasma glomeromycotorum]MCE8168534.1 hypothetical protein [Candidatus Moeniiplasma glomeromycotorum]
MNTTLLCYILEDGTKLLNEKEVQRVLRETVFSVQKLALTSISKTRKEFLKSLGKHYSQLFADFNGDNSAKADLDKLLKACATTPPLRRKMRKRVSF